MRPGEERANARDGGPGFRFFRVTVLLDANTLAPNLFRRELPVDTAQEVGEAVPVLTPISVSDLGLNEGRGGRWSLAVSENLPGPDPASVDSQARAAVLTAPDEEVDYGTVGLVSDDWTHASAIWTGSRLLAASSAAQGLWVQDLTAVDAPRVVIRSGGGPVWGPQFVGAEEGVLLVAVTEAGLHIWNVSEQGEVMDENVVTLDEIPGSFTVARRPGGFSLVAARGSSLFGSPSAPGLWFVPLLPNGRPSSAPRVVADDYEFETTHMDSETFGDELLLIANRRRPGQGMSAWRMQLLAMNVDGELRQLSEVARWMSEFDAKLAADGRLWLAAGDEVYQFSCEPTD